MSRRPTIVICALCALALPSAALARSPIVITALATQTSDHRSGKTVTFKETLRSTTGKLLGHDTVSCTSAATAATCKATFTLTRGTLHVAGTVTQGTPQSVLHVRSGTGAYKGRKGTVVLVFRSQSQALETFHLT